MKNITLPNATFKGDIAPRLILILFLVPCLLVSSRPSAASGQIDAALQEPALPSPTLEAHLAEISTRLETQETIPVIIRLRTPFSPQVEAEGGQRMVGQRRAIQDTRTQLLARLTLRDPRSLKSFRVLPLVALSIDRAGLEVLRNSPELLDISIDQQYRLMPNESSISSTANESFDSEYDGTGQTVVVIDSGIDYTHPALKDKVVAEACFSADDPDDRYLSLCPNRQTTAVGPGTGLNCDPSIVGCYFGTAQAGIIAGQGGGYKGVAPGAKLISIQIFSRFNSDYCTAESEFCLTTFDSEVARAFEHAYLLSREHRIAAVNFTMIRGILPYSTSCDDVVPEIKTAIDLLATVGIPVITSSGNNRAAGGLAYPSCISNVVSVAAANQLGQLFPYTNRAFFLSLVAPSENIAVPDVGGRFTTSTQPWYGVSSVSGAWAILRQKQPNASINEILTALTSGAKKIVDMSNGKEYPLLDILGALRDIDQVLSPYPAPINLSVKLLPVNRVELKWVDRSTTETGFRIFRKLHPQEDSREISRVSPNQTGFIDENLSMNGIYVYQVQATFAGGESLPSHMSSIRATGPSLVPTFNLEAEVLSSTQVNLKWNVDYSFGDVVALARKDLTTKDTIPIPLARGSKSYTETSLRPGASYEYFVYLLKASGKVTISTPVTVTLPQIDIDLVTESGDSILDFGTVTPTSDPASPRLTRTIRIRNIVRIPIPVLLAIIDPLDPEVPEFGTHYYNFPYTVTDQATGSVDKGTLPYRVTLKPNEERLITIQLNREIPRPITLPPVFPADLLPPKITATFLMVTEVERQGYRLVDLGAQVEPRARLINPVDTSQPATVDFRRDGNGIEVAFSLYDPNLDASLVTYQFYDQIGRPVGKPINYYPGMSLRSSPILPGMSLTIKRRFTNLERFSDLRSVRVTVFDKDGSDTAISIPVGDLGSAQPK